MALDTIFAQLARFGVVPVIAIDHVEYALPLADALIRGGLPVAEITFRTAAAAEVISIMAKERPQLLLGAGTVLTPKIAETAKACGAQFAVAPGLNPRVVAHARQIGLPFVPGVATPSDIEAGLELDCQLLKFFPAEALGGVAMLDALSAPYRHTGLRFMPTGGASPGNLAAYVKLATVATVGGTWIAKNEDMAAGRWAAISERCQAALAIVAAARGA